MYWSSSSSTSLCVYNIPNLRYGFYCAFTQNNECYWIIHAHTCVRAYRQIVHGFYSCVNNSLYNKMYVQYVNEIIRFHVWSICMCCVLPPPHDHFECTVFYALFESILDSIFKKNVRSRGRFVIVVIIRVLLM